MLLSLFKPQVFISWSTALEQHRVNWREREDKAQLHRLGLNVNV